MKEPLGRIHPHGSAGKSVYQRAADEANYNSTGFGRILFRCLGLILLSIGGIGLIGAFAEPGSLGLAGAIIAAGISFLND